MSTEFALDLRAARRKAGYTQGDIAHLLDHHQSHVSDQEQGRGRPSLDQIMTLSLIYGRSFESFFGTVLAECQGKLTTRLASLPPGTNTAGTFNRDSSLKKLERRLKMQSNDYGSA
jgi:transcriptional regulator with XRE-family HTH domain